MALLRLRMAAVEAEAVEAVEAVPVVVTAEAEHRLAMAAATAAAPGVATSAT